MDKELFRKLTASIKEAIEIKHGKKKPSRIIKYDSVNVKNPNAVMKALRG